MRGLDLLDGVHIEYSSCIPPRDAIVRSDEKTIQFTGGCATFLILTPTKSMAQSVPVIKNSDKWRNFANGNTRELQRFLESKVHAWSKYSYRNTDWYFNLYGKVSFNSDCIEWYPVLHRTDPQQIRHWDHVYCSHGVHEV